MNPGTEVITIQGLLNWPVSELVGVYVSTRFQAKLLELHGLKSV